MTIISSNIDSAGNAVQVNSNYQQILVEPNIYVLSSGTNYAIIESTTYGEASVLNYGTVSGFFGVGFGGYGSVLHNFTSGKIDGSDAGVYIVSQSGNVLNDGEIFGNGDGIYSSKGGLSVNNTGSISGTYYGISVGNIANSILNSGSIKSNNDAIYFASAASGTIVNSGFIQGVSAIDAQVAAALNVRNSGSIDGDVILGDAVNNVVNTGSIVGNVSLGDGGSSFNGKGGTVTGTITGGTGADRIVAGNDGETLAGGGGHDTLFGGAGQDTFAFSSAQTADTDVVHWFKVADDTIQLDHNAFTALTPGTSPVFAIASAATTVSDHLFYNSATGVLSYDADGSGTTNAAQPIATLDTGLALTAHNFTVV